MTKESNRRNSRAAAVHKEQRKSSGTSCGDLLEKFIIIDRFGEDLKFTLPGNRTEYKSLCGSLLTILVFILVAGYASFKAQ